MIGDAIGAGRANGVEPTWRWRDRWLTGRALLLHSAVVTVISGCVAAAWWQATRALAGNGLSWFYTVEWPAFAVIAVWGWWHLLHEDPEAYRARRQHPASEESRAEASRAVQESPAKPLTVEPGDARLATALAVLVAAESGLGVASVVLVPLGRPSGLLPANSALVYPLHAALGGALLIGAGVLLRRVRTSSRLGRLTGWLGGTGTATAAAGGLLSASHPLRFAGMAVMLLGAVIASFGYAIPAIEKLS